MQDELLGLKMFCRNEIVPSCDQRCGGVECGLKVEHIVPTVASWRQTDTETSLPEMSLETFTLALEE